jgi:hypothetical protein
MTSGVTYLGMLKGSSVPPRSGVRDGAFAIAGLAGNAKAASISSNASENSSFFIYFSFITKNIDHYLLDLPNLCLLISTSLLCELTPSRHRHLWHPLHYVSQLPDTCFSLSHALL